MTEYVEEFVTKAGLPARIWRGESKYSGDWFCGYVQVPKDHPLHGKQYNQVVDDAFAKAFQVLKEGPVGKRGVIDLLCMMAGGETHYGYLFDVHGGLTFSDLDKETGEFWYGFDCAHAGDRIEVQDLAYTERECEALAAQIKQFAEVV